eukprot:1656820-Amphidinium_carterae.2
MNFSVAWICSAKRSACPSWRCIATASTGEELFQESPRHLHCANQVASSKRPSHTKGAEMDLMVLGSYSAATTYYTTRITSSDLRVSETKRSA